MLVPSDHQEILDELARLSGILRALVAPLAEEQFNWQAEAGKTWSVGQCIDHLARTNQLYLPELVAAAETGRAAGRARRDALRPNRLGRWFIRMIEPPPRFRVRAPLPALVPASQCPKDVTWNNFQDSQLAIAELLRSTSDLDLTGIRFRNPLAKNLRLFNLATGFLIVAAHERRHLAQAQGVRARDAFPG